MKKICDFCKHQSIGPNGRGIGCGAAHIHTDKDGYGQFKHGARCVHDSDLSDLFEPRTGEEISVRNMASLIERHSDDLMKARDSISRLQQRLVCVDNAEKTEQEVK